MLTVEEIARRRGRAIGLEFDRPAAAFLRAEDRTARSDRDAIRASRVAPELGDFSSRRIVAIDTLLFHCTEEHRASVPRKPTGRALIRSRHSFEIPRHIWS